MDQQSFRGEIDVRGVSSSLSDQSQGQDYVASVVGSTSQPDRPTSAQSCIASNGSEADRESICSDSGTMAVHGEQEHQQTSGLCHSEQVDTSREGNKLWRLLQISEATTKRADGVQNTFTAPALSPETPHRPSVVPSAQRSTWQTVPKKMTQLKRGLSVFNAGYFTHCKPPLPPAPNSQPANISVSYPYEMDPSRPPHYEAAGGSAPAAPPAVRTQMPQRHSSEAEDAIGVIDAMGGRNCTYTQCFRSQFTTACDSCHYKNTPNLYNPQSISVCYSCLLSVFLISWSSV